MSTINGVDVDDLPYPNLDIWEEENERREYCSLLPFCGVSKDGTPELCSHTGPCSVYHLTKFLLVGTISLCVATNMAVVSTFLQLKRKSGYPKPLGAVPQFMELPPEIIRKVCHFIS
jgi:hypothetical protein